MKKEIELPELTKEQADFVDIEKDDDILVGTSRQLLVVLDKARFHGLSNADFLIACLVGYTIKKEPKYYIHIIKDDSRGYLNIDKSSEFYFISGKEESNLVQTQFTEEKIKSHYPNLWKSRELVEDDN